MQTNQESQHRKAGAVNTAWAELRALCPKIEALSKIPFRIVDLEGNLIFQSRSAFREPLNTILTLDGRHGDRLYFRILCDVDETDAEAALSLMFALRKIGLSFHAAEKRGESLLQEITRSYSLLHFFYTLPNLLSQGYSRKRLCEISLFRICKTLNVERGSIFLYNAKARSFQLVAMKGRTIFRPELVKMNARIIDWIRHQNRPLLIEDVNRFPNFKGVGEYRTRTFLASPIFSHPSVREKRVSGFINLSDPVGRPTFNSHDLKFAGAAATFAVFLAMTKPKRTNDSNFLRSSTPGGSL